MRVNNYKSDLREGKGEGEKGKNINKLFSIYQLKVGRIAKNCDLGLEKTALGLRSRAAFSRPRSQFCGIRTYQPANNTCIFLIPGRPSFFGWKTKTIKP